MSSYSFKTKTGFGSQISDGVGEGIKERSCAGHVNQEYCANKAGKKKEKMKVKIAPPRNPSQVLFGDKDKKGALINFRPKEIPQK